MKYRLLLVLLVNIALLPAAAAAGGADSSGDPRKDGKRGHTVNAIDRPEEVTEDLNVRATFGMDVLRATLRDPKVIQIRHDQLKLDGFHVDLYTSRRWPHVTRDKPGGRVWAPAPKPGRYHVGFMMYDGGNDERVAIRIGDRVRGVAVGKRNNNRTWLYWLREAYDFTGREDVSLVGVGPDGKHGICNLLFLPQPPPVREIPFEVQHTATATRIAAPGRVTVSWTTTSPSHTRFEYGRDTGYGHVFAREDSTLVHRAVLVGLARGIEYHGRGVGTRPDGTNYHGPDVTFRADPPVPPPTVGKTCQVPLTIRNPLPAAVRRWPTTTGVPIPQGELADAEHVRLVHDGRQVPAQVRTTGTWPDGSVKWLLVSFVADVQGAAKAVYTLEFGRDVGRRPPADPIRVTQTADGVAVDTGAIRFRIDGHGGIADLFRGEERVLPAGKACGTVIRASGGATHRTSLGKATVTIEESGPIRAMIKTVCPAIAEDGAALFRIEKRIAAYRGSALIHIWHTFVITAEEEFTSIEEMTFRAPLGAGRWHALQADGRPVVLKAETPTVCQRLDDAFVTGRGKGQKPTKGRLLGTLLSAAPENLGVAVRDAWQNYPKGFRVTDGGLEVDLCPDFEAGLYDGFPFEKEGHQLYYYLLDGHYRFKTGMAKTHELLLSLEPEPNRSALCAAFQRPLPATAPPAWYCNSKAFYRVAPRDTKRFGAYEEGIERNLRRYVARRERQRDYGLMNYGDWYGERGSNWGNIEYDTQHAFFLQYIRSGDPEAFFLGEAAELHNRDIDTVQWATNPDRLGHVYIHQMCHVGGYYDKRVPGTIGWPRAGGGVSHAWTEGHFDHYFLTGDPRSWDTGRAIADHYIRKNFRRPYDFLSCRNPGWHLILNAATYAATGDPYYLNASRVIVDRVLEAQDTTSRPLPAYQRESGRTHQLGGWSRMMVPGHCRCEPRHRGNAGFMVAVLLVGLKYHYDVTADPRVKDCIILGARSLLDECYSAEHKAFRYTSCPKMPYNQSATPLKAEAIARAYRWTGDARFGEVLTDALPKGFGGAAYGKSFSAYYRCGPRMLADIPRSLSLAPRSQRAPRPR